MIHIEEYKGYFLISKMFMLQTCFDKFSSLHLLQKKSFEFLLRICSELLAEYIGYEMRIEGNWLLEILDVT